MSQRMQADMSARMTALHDHISSVSSTHQPATGPDHMTALVAHVTSTDSTEDEKKKEVVCLMQM